MRTIKFRVWDKDKLEIIEPICFLQKGIAIALDGEPIWDETLVGDRLIPLQWTGLLDKNSKEIYEGDIIKFKLSSTLTREIKWIGSGFWVEIEGTLHLPNKMEVIGNRYENPELCSTKKY